MATLTEFKRKVKPGTRMLCVRNTYRPELDGQRREVSKAQGNGFQWRGESDERQSFTYWPLKRNIVSVSDTEITFYLFPDFPEEQRQHHTVTLRLWAEDHERLS